MSKLDLKEKSTRSRQVRRPFVSKQKHEKEKGTGVRKNMIHVGQLRPS